MAVNERPEDLIDKLLIISRQTADSNELSGWFGNDIENRNTTGTYNLLYNASLMVKENLGYALCIDKLIDTSGDSELCFRPLAPVRSSFKYGVEKHQVFFSAAVTFLNQLRQNITP